MLEKATRDGDMEIFIITNLPKKAAAAKKIANIYRGRWTIETSLQELEKWFNSIHKPPRSIGIRIEKVLLLPRGHVLWVQT